MCTFTGMGSAASRSVQTGRSRSCRPSVSASWPFRARTPVRSSRVDTRTAWYTDSVRSHACQANRAPSASLMRVVFDASALRRRELAQGSAGIGVPVRWLPRTATLDVGPIVVRNDVDVGYSQRRLLAREHLREHLAQGEDV